MNERGWFADLAFLSMKLAFEIDIEQILETFYANHPNKSIVLLHILLFTFFL